jgi:nucleotide-binding universal stress UspA family protein
MTPRIIAAPLFGGPADATTVAAALAVARRFDGQVIGLFVHGSTADAVPIVGEGLSPEVVEQIVEAAKTDVDRRREVARRAFDTACAEGGVRIARQLRPAEHVVAVWHEVEGLAESVLPRNARLSDLVVMARSEEEQARSATEATLLGCGRGVLIVPPEAVVRVETVAVAWNQGLEAARAVAAGLPFLGEAKDVHVLVADDEDVFAASTELQDYLEAHGIVSQRRLVRRGDEATGVALLRAAGEAQADLLVMGAYGHSRLRELVFGGVTHHVLAEATLPVLLAH